MIIIKLEGGLGNQMFQYAIASILAKKNNASVLLDKFFFEQTEKRLGHTPRNFELIIFNNTYIQVSETNLLIFNQLSIKNKIKRTLGLNYPKTYNEPFFNFDQKVLSIKTPVFLKGYFQSYRYFIGHEDFVKKVFTFPNEALDIVNTKLLFSIKGINSISIHIRRGDYINDIKTQKYHGNCGLDYYLKAISLLTKRNKDFMLFFFSDDNHWVKEQFEDLPYPKLFIDHNKGENSWKDMLLMSSCNHNIIANSSFSWWAAWLNTNPKKMVIAPKKWFAKSEEEMPTSDLIPNEWIRL